MPRPNDHRRSLALAVSLGLAIALMPACDECDGDLDCPSTQVCSGGVCERFVCAHDRDCPPGQACGANRCRTSPTAGNDAETPDGGPDAFVLGGVSPRG